MIEGKWYRYLDEDKYLRFYGRDSQGFYLFDKRVNIESSKRFTICNFNPIQDKWLRPVTKDEIEKFNLE